MNLKSYAPPKVIAVASLAWMPAPDRRSASFLVSRVRHRGVQRAGVVGADEAECAAAGRSSLRIDSRRSPSSENATSIVKPPIFGLVYQSVLFMKPALPTTVPASKRVRRRTGVVVVHADVIVGRVVHRPDRAAQADGAEAALQAGEAVAAGEDVSAVGQVDAALDLEDRLQPRGKILVVAEADARGVVHELVVRLVRDARGVAVVGLDALRGDVDAPVDLELGRYRCANAGMAKADATAAARSLRFMLSLPYSVRGTPPWGRTLRPERPGCCEMSQSVSSPQQFRG